MEVKIALEMVNNRSNGTSVSFINVNNYNTNYKVTEGNGIETQMAATPSEAMTLASGNYDFPVSVSSFTIPNSGLWFSIRTLAISQWKLQILSQLELDCKPHKVLRQGFAKGFAEFFFSALKLNFGGNFEVPCLLRQNSFVTRSSLFFSSFIVGRSEKN